MKRLYYSLYLTLLTGSMLVAGCGGPPQDNPLLDEARAALASAERDSAVVAYAPTALEEAEGSLRRGEQLLEAGADAEEVEHYAYLTRQHLAIAEERARLSAAEEAIERAELERKEVMLEVREQEAEQARRDAEAREREAALAHEQAEAAQARADELAEKIRELEAQQTERGLVLTLSDVLFDVGKATLKEGGLRTVEKLAAFLTEYPERNVLVEGHTDNTGSEETNLELSRRRAEAVRDALVGRGIDASRIRTVGYGEMYPLATNDTTSGRQQNRRVEVIISAEDGEVSARQ